MTSHSGDAEVKLLLSGLLANGMPSSFIELFHLLHSKPIGNNEQPATKEFLDNLVAHMCAAEGAKRRGDAAAVTSEYMEVSKLYGARGQTRLAMFFLERSLELARACGSSSLECLALHELVVVHESRGETGEAVAAAEAHRVSAARAGDAAEAGRAAEELSRTYKAQALEAEVQAESEPGSDASLQLHLLELTAARDCGDALGEADACFAVGRAYSMAKQPQAGVGYFKQYLRLAKALPVSSNGPQHVARAYAGLAAAHVSMSAYDAASECLHEVLHVATESGNVPAHASALEALGTLAARQGTYGRAEEALAAAYALRKHLVDEGAPGASRPELDKTRILLGLVKGAGKGSRAGALLTSVVHRNVAALLEWRIGRVELTPHVPAHAVGLSRLMSTTYHPSGLQGGDSSGVAGQEEGGVLAAEAAAEAGPGQ